MGGGEEGIQGINGDGTTKKKRGKRKKKITKTLQLLLYFCSVKLLVPKAHRLAPDRLRVDSPRDA